MERSGGQSVVERATPRVGLKTRKRVEQAAEQPRVLLRPEEVGNPFSREVLSARASSEDYYGAFSVENFAAASPLFDTHEDAQGWLAHVEKFKPRNFWYQDANVAAWAYYEDYDNWEDTYGADAVMAMYHSGHGTMDSNGVFYAALGSNWGGLGTNAMSSRMKLGNEQVRYLFWSTCYSLRVLNGHSPIRTWHPANLGFRMLFGYETTSVDSPKYGSAFWKQWNTGKSFSKAFLDASWYDISTNQSPAVVAVGSTAADAANRLNNERLFSFAAVPANYYQWTYYAAARSRAPGLRLPQRIVTARLAPYADSVSRARALLARLPLPMRMPRELVAGADGTVLHTQGERHLALMPDGTYEVQFAAPNRESRKRAALATTLRTAHDFLREAGIEREDLVFDRVLQRYEGGGSPKGSGRLEAPRVVETAVRFVQTIDGVPVVAPGLGSVTVTVDNDLNITALSDRSRPVAKLSERTVRVPPADGEGLSAEALPAPEALLQGAWEKRMKQFLVRGPMPRAFTVVPGSAEVGYAIQGNSAILVARQEVEVDCGGGFLKRFIVEEPIRP